jgi:hypothetical protein
MYIKSSLKDFVARGLKGLLAELCTSSSRSAAPRSPKGPSTVKKARFFPKSCSRTSFISTKEGDRSLLLIIALALDTLMV